jgi:macrodomain Ter protein organizer (MatP/YcbG family)
MARPRYSITGADKRLAVQYLERRVREERDHVQRGFPSYLAHLEAGHAQRAVRSFEDDSRKLETLNAWVVRYLNDAQRKQLQNAIRQSRRRATFPELKTITVSGKAWRYLSDLSLRDKITLSEVIERYLHAEWTKEIDAELGDVPSAVELRLTRGGSE